MRISTAILLALLPIGLAAPLEVRDQDTAVVTKPGSSSSTGPDAGNPLTNPLSGLTNPGGIGALLGVTSDVFGTVAGATDILGGAGLTGLTVRDLDDLPAPSLKRMEDLILDIRAELGTYLEDTQPLKKRQGSLPVQTIGDLLNNKGLAMLSGFTSQPTDVLSKLPVDQLDTLATPGQLLQIIFAGGQNVVARRDDGSDTLLDILEADRLIAI